MRTFCAEPEGLRVAVRKAKQFMRNVFEGIALRSCAAEWSAVTELIFLSKGGNRLDCSP